jgi:photosystem II stability/assembly factor-like uncharacterized protein
LGGHERVSIDLRYKRSMSRTFLLVLFVACGAGTPTARVTPVQPTAKTIEAPLAVPNGAKWVFVEPESGLHDKLDLGDRGTLYVGEHGRREIIKGGAATDAETLAPDTIVRVMRDDKGNYVFLTDGSDVYVARDPLGPFDSVRKGPADVDHDVRVKDWANGKTAMLLVLSDGRVMRTTDYGLTWRSVDYAGATKPLGHPSTLAMDHTGHGILVHIPQRIYVTSDEGATWAPIASPASGARFAINDGERHIFVEGFMHQLAKLDDGKLVATDEVPVDMTTPLSPTTPHSDARTVRVLAGDHVVEIEPRPKKSFRSYAVVIRSTRLGDKPGPATPVAALETPNSSLYGHLAAFGPQLLFLRTDPVDENTQTSTLLTSDDYGATWKEGVVFENSELATDTVRLVAGPRGWAYVGQLCGNPGEHQERNCSHRQVRLAGKSTFEDLLFTEEMQPMSFTFDERHDKVYAVGRHDWRLAVYQSQLSQNRFSRVALKDVGDGSSERLLSVDDAGTLRVLTYDPERKAYVVQRVDVSGKELPALYLPNDTFNRDGRVGKMTFAGPHGVLFSGESYGWETADGGQTWARVGTTGASDAICTEAGCVTDETQRIGWDLPALKTSEIVTATADDPADKPKPPSPRGDLPPQAPPLALACTAASATTELEHQPAFDHVNEASDVRWIESLEEDSKVTVVVGGRTATRRLTLLEAVPKPQPHAESQKKNALKWSDEGLIAARLSYKNQKDVEWVPTSPVDIELSWFSTRTGRSHHGLVGKQELSRIAAWGRITGDAEIVRGGLLYQATDTSPVFFVHDDGKVESMTSPAHVTLTRAQHGDGGNWMLYGADYLGNAQLSWTADGGKSWHQRVWTLADDVQRPDLFATGGASWVRINASPGALLFPIVQPIADDPPSPTRLAQGVDAACDPKMAWSPTSPPEPFSGSVKVSLASGKTPLELAANRRIVHPLPTGAGYCTSGYALVGSPTTMVVYRDGAAWSGWSFRPSEKGSRWLAEPMKCK